MAKGMALPQWIFIFKKGSTMKRKIFTKRFFEMTGDDQAAVVSANITDIENTIGRHMAPIHDRQAEQRVKRIRARAAKHGIDGV